MLCNRIGEGLVGRKTSGVKEWMFKSKMVTRESREIKGESIKATAVSQPVRSMEHLGGCGRMKHPVIPA